MTLAWTLRVQIEDGCNFDFGFDKNESIGGFFRCVFNNCVNQSSIVRLPTFLSYDVQPSWNEALEWQFDDKTLKRLKKYGSSIKLQLFMIREWNNHEMNTFPIRNFKKNKQKYNVQEIGYIVLDLKVAIANGTKQTVNEAAYLRIRNIKIIKNNGVNPQVKISFYCGVQTKWNEANDDENIKPNDLYSSVASIPQIPASNKASPKRIKSSPKPKQINKDDNKSNNMPYIIGNKWFCNFHDIHIFLDISNINCRLLIVSMNEEFIFKLPLNDQYNEISNDYPHFACYLQSKATDWCTIASYSCNIHEFISDNHSKAFLLKLYGSQNQCIAQANVSISWQAYTKKEEIAAETQYSSFTVDSITQMLDNNEEEEEQQQEIESEPEYIAYNKLNPNYNNMKMNWMQNENNASDADVVHKYRIGIDLRSVRDFESSLFSLQCRYKYNLFDDNRLFSSHPNISVHKSEEQTITNGFCAYEIVLNSSQLRDNFYKYPLIIQCVADNMRGFSFIHLCNLLQTQASSSNLRYLDEYHPIYAVKGENIEERVQKYDDLNKIECKAIGNIRVCCSLEEFEIIKKKKEIEVEEKKTEKQQTEKQQTNPTKYFEQEIMREIEKWKKEQQNEWQKRWKKIEENKLNELELEWKKCEELRSEELNKKKLGIIKLEKKLKTSLYDIEAQEKKIKMEQMRIEERKRELQQNYKLKTNEIVSSLKRLRNDHKMEIETLNRTTNFLKNENELISTKYKNEEKRCNEFRNELLKNKKQFDQSSMGQLQVENNKLNQEIIQMNEKLNDKRIEIQQLNAKIDRLEVKNKELQNENVQQQQKQIEKEKKQMEKLKVELMAKSHFKQLRNDRNELQQIKNTLNKIMHP